MSTLAAPIEVFYSYADADELLCIELNKHLSLLRQEGLIAPWHKRQISPGTDWMKALDEHLNIASIILLLISADFVASDYCYGTEMQRAMERHCAGEARVIPILLRPVDWQSAPFGKLRALPSDGKPVTSWSDRNDALVDVVQGIRAVLGEVSSPVTSQASLPLSSTKNGAVVVTRLRALLSYGKLRGKGIRLNNIILFGSRIDIDT